MDKKTIVEKFKIKPVVIDGEPCIDARLFGKITGLDRGQIFWARKNINRAGDQLRSVVVGSNLYIPLDEITRYKFTTRSKITYYKLDRFGGKKTYAIS